MCLLLLAFQYLHSDFFDLHDETAPRAFQVTRDETTHYDLGVLVLAVLTRILYAHTNLQKERL